MRFEIGDRVIGKGVADDIDITGFVGTIAAIDGGDVYPYGVAFDEEHPMFHNLGGYCQNSHGWWCYEDVLEPYDEEEVKVELKFKVGDRVRCKPFREYLDINVLTGTICYIMPSNNSYPYGIRFDAPNYRFHSCFDHCDDEHGWFCGEDELTLLPERSIKELEDMWE